MNTYKKSKEYTLGVGGNLFELSDQYLDFPKGTLVFRGDACNETGAREYFNMTREMETGESYSTYEIPDQLLGEPTPQDIEKVQKYFNKLNG